MVIECPPAPYTRLRISAPPPLRPPWFELYDGKHGATMRGSHVGSASVFGLSSVSAKWIAVSGRQRVYWYFVPNDTVALSLMAMLISANVRALSERDRCSAAESCLAAMFMT